MNVRVWRLCATIVLIAFFVACSSVPGTDFSGEPSNETFDRIVKSLWDSEMVASGTMRFDNRPKARCVAVPTYPNPDRRSNSSKPFAWSMDFIDATPIKEERSRQLKKLDALVKVGLLQKNPVEMEKDGVKTKAVRYGLTDKGWEATLEATTGNHTNYCFVYGTPRYLGVTKYEPFPYSKQRNIEGYNVVAKVGFASEAELEPWARDQEVQAAFPEIRRDVQGQELKLPLVREGEEWLDYQTFSQGIDRNKVEARRRAQMEKMEQEHKELLDELRKLPPPTEDEVKGLVRKQYEIGKHGLEPWPLACVDLPGSEKLPVDKELMGYNPPRYAVGIFENKDRKPYDRIAKKTIPYLEMLVSIGVLTKRVVKDIPGKGRDSKANSDGSIYELTAKYLSKTHERYPYCFPLGPPTVEFVAFKLHSDMKYPKMTRFKYRIKLLYKTVPDWAKDPVLLSNWDELRGAVEHGKACEGDFGFDLKTRDSVSGGGTCWWAFDSYYENY